MTNSNREHAPSALSAAGRHRRPLLIAFVLALFYALVEAGAGI